MSETFDVAVVGGGISGIYTAWRLLDPDAAGNPVLGAPAAEGDGRLRVGLFECSDRIGGRLFSVTIPGVPHLPVELGGMRFLDIHTRVAGLIEHLGLRHREMPVDDPAGANLNYLRGHHFTVADWKRPSFVPPYRLEGSERIRTPGDLIIQVALKHQHTASSLHDRGFWNLLYDELSAEAYSLTKDAGGYYTLVNNWNAGVAVPFLLADFGLDVKYRALADGFQALPLKLAEQVRGRGGTIHHGHRLHRLDLDRSGPEPLVRLTFDVADPEDFDHYRRVANPVVHWARHVVLALPRRAIELLHPDSLIFDSPQFEDDLRSVLPQPALKIFAAYHTPWWTEARGITAGRSVTDLPIRQCYYWGTEGAQPGADPNNRNSILMASYNDGSSVEFWSGLARAPKKYEPRSAMFAAAARGAEPLPEKLRAPDGMVRELQEQLRELHGVAAGRIPDPYETVYQDWAQDPYGGGWHFWRIHRRPEDVMPRIQRPRKDAQVYICGEAWSTQQGWVEGALETADSVLERYLGVPRPEWWRRPGPDGEVGPAGLVALESVQARG